MAGTRLGGFKARDTNNTRYPGFYKRIGTLGGTVSQGGGFGSENVGPDGLTGRARAKIAGVKGGKASRRTKA